MCTLHLNEHAVHFHFLAVSTLLLIPNIDGRHTERKGCSIRCFNRQSISADSCTKIECTKRFDLGWLYFHFLLPLFSHFKIDASSSINLQHGFDWYHSFFFFVTLAIKCGKQNLLQTFKMENIVKHWFSEDFVQLGGHCTKREQEKKKIFK